MPNFVFQVENDLERGLRFLDHLLTDIVMLPYAPDRITNLDIADKLGRLGTQLGEGRLNRLLFGLRDLQSLLRSNIQLPFHVKTYLISVFTG